MNPTNNHEISLQTAIDMTTRYRGNRPEQSPICETFEKAAVAKLLATEGCSSLRIYYGMKEDMSIDAILVAVNTDGEDILPVTTNALEAMDEPIILEDGLRCPDHCPPKSSLNSELV
jgi:hypothetical protein